MDISLNSDGFIWFVLCTESDSNSVSWEDKHLLGHALEMDLGIHDWINHWLILNVDGNLVAKDEASLLVFLILVADIQVGEWDLILNLYTLTTSSSHLDVFSVIKASCGTSKSSSLSVLEVNLDFIISHTFHHLTSHFKETKRFDIGFVGIVEKLNCVCFTTTAEKWLLLDFTGLV